MATVNACRPRKLPPGLRWAGHASRGGQQDLPRLADRAGWYLLCHAPIRFSAVAMASVDCPFCSVDASQIEAADGLAFVIRDRFPVTPLHTLVLPRRHASSYFDLTCDELTAIGILLFQARERIARMDPTVEGFTIGINVGEVAGQTISHCHVHLMPRRRGDVPDPFGGVRGLFPGRAHYPTATAGRDVGGT
jgi:diadenosine tetraphosphate (Ap4A) HIT family hydrolase